MAAPILKFPHKELRAEVILNYIKGTKYDGIVCITCGEAGKALQEAAKGTDIKVVVLTPEDEWWTMERIATEYPNYFDATSGHLPLWLMQRVADRFREYFNVNKMSIPEGDEGWRVPTGSGETIFELELMGSVAIWTALYDYNRGSKFEGQSPLNNAVATFFPIHFYASRSGDKE